MSNKNSKFLSQRLSKECQLLPRGMRMNTTRDNSNGEAYSEISQWTSNHDAIKQVGRFTNMSLFSNHQKNTPILSSKHRDNSESTNNEAAPAFDVERVVRPRRDKSYVHPYTQIKELQSQMELLEIELTQTK